MRPYTAHVSPLTQRICALNTAHLTNCSQLLLTSFKTFPVVFFVLPKYSMENSDNSNFFFFLGRNFVSQKPDSSFLFPSTTGRRCSAQDAG
jgi:hypothetical protein